MLSACQGVGCLRNQGVQSAFYSASVPWRWERTGEVCTAGELFSDFKSEQKPVFPHTLCHTIRYFPSPVAKV